MKSHNADKYMFHDASGLNCIGAEALFNMLAQSGASTQYASKLYASYPCSVLLFFALLKNMILGITLLLYLPYIVWVVIRILAC